MFDKADKDGDGKLTKDEWFNVLNSSGCDTSMYVFLLQYMEIILFNAIYIIFFLQILQGRSF